MEGELVVFLHLIAYHYSGLNEIIGIVVGHAYFFVMFKYPQDLGGAVLLRTPQFL